MPLQLLAGLVNALANGAAGLSGGKATPTELQTANSPMLAGINDFLGNQPTAAEAGKTPRAFLNWILFDKQFKYVPQLAKPKAWGSRLIRVDWYDDLRLQSLMQEGLPVIKSGYPLNLQGMRAVTGGADDLLSLKGGAPLKGYG